MTGPFSRRSCAIEILEEFMFNTSLVDSVQRRKHETEYDVKEDKAFPPCEATETTSWRLAVLLAC